MLAQGLRDSTNFLNLYQLDTKHGDLFVLFHPNLQHPISDSHWKTWYLFDRRQRKYLTCPDIKPSAMPGADDFMALNITLAQGAVVVGADIRYGVIIAGNVENNDGIIPECDK